MSKNKISDNSDLIKNLNASIKEKKSKKFIQIQPKILQENYSYSITPIIINN